MFKKIYGNVLKKYLKNPDVTKIDYIIFSIMAMFCFSFFMHYDLFLFLESGASLIEGIRDGFFLKIYSYSNDVAEIHPNIFAFSMNLLNAIYQIIPFIISSLFNIPFKNTVWNLYFVRFELIFVYVFVAYLIYLISMQLNIDKRSAKWAAFVWMTTPLAFYSLFIYGRPDISYLCILLAALLFHLKKRPYVFCILISFAIAVYPTLLVPFVPLVLLTDKKILNILKKLILGYSVTLIQTLVFSGDPGASQVTWIHESFSKSLSARGQVISIGTISFFFVGWILLSIFAYVKSPESKEEYDYMSIYIPLIAFFLLFVLSGIISTYSILPLTAFTTIILFLNKNRNKNFAWFLDIAVWISYLFASVAILAHYVDQNLLIRGLLPYLAGFNIAEAQNQRFYGASITSMQDMLFFHPLILPFLFSVFFSASVAIAVYTFPSFHFKKTKESGTTDTYQTNRLYVVFVRFLAVLLAFIVLAFISYFTYRGDAIIDKSANAEDVAYTYSLNEHGSIMQTFTSPGDNVSEIWVNYHATSDYRNDKAEVNIEIIDLSDSFAENNSDALNKIIYRETFALHKVIDEDIMGAFYYVFGALEKPNEDVLKINTRNLNLKIDGKYGILFSSSHFGEKDDFKPAVVAVENIPADSNERELIVGGDIVDAQLDFSVYSMPQKVQKSIVVPGDTLASMETNSSPDMPCAIDSMNGINKDEIYNVPKYQWGYFVQHFKNLERVRYLNFRGYAFDIEQNSLAKEVYIEISGQLFSTTYGQRRADIAVRQNNPELINSGFSSKIPLNYLTPGLNRARLIVVSKTGEYYYHGESIEFYL